MGALGLDFLDDGHLPGLFLPGVPNPQPDLESPNVDPHRNLGRALRQETRVSIAPRQRTVPVHRVEDGSAEPRVKRPLVGIIRVQGECRGQERKVIERENLDVAMRVLNSLPARDREILMRFYLRGQTPRQICREMNLTDTQFRLVKSRAKARFTELGKARMARRTGFTLPTSANEF